MVNLTDKVVVITGASSGIGKATAVEFAQKSASVVLAARRLEKLVELQEYILTFNKKCICVRADVSNAADVAALFDRAWEEFGRVDILVNNAGRGLKCELVDIAVEDWRAVIDTNLTGVFLCTAEAARRMKQKNTAGHIITVCSIAGLFGAATYSAYCASKHGVRGFLKAVKGELKKYNIRLSTIYPARVDTEFFDIYHKRPDKRQMLDARDIARYIVAIAGRRRCAIVAVRCANFIKRVLSLAGAR